jgi:alpha-methylacyl-CoA racemase
MGEYFSPPFGYVTLCYNTYNTMDGKFIALGALEPKFWANFCKKMGREDLLEKRKMRQPMN